VSAADAGRIPQDGAGELGDGLHGTSDLAEMDARTWASRTHRNARAVT
jgi:hypothetical protein